LTIFKGLYMTGSFYF